MSRVEPIPSSTSMTVYAGPVLEEDPLTQSVGLRKPDGWPAVMQWPPHRLAKGIRNGDITRETAPKYQRYYDKYAQLTVSQSEKFAEHIKTHPSRYEDLVADKAIFKKKKKFGYDETRHHNNVAWAFMLDPNADFRSSYDQVVATIGFTTLTTLDGGKITATQDTLHVRKGTELTTQIMIEEALARGWPSITVRGNKKFVMEVMKKAKERGLEVDAKVTGLFGMTQPKFQTSEVMTIDKTAHQELAALLEDTGMTGTKQTKKDADIIPDAGHQPNM